MDNEKIHRYLDQFLEKTRFGTGDSDGHLMSLFSLALASKGKIYLELGVRHGVTTPGLLLAAHLNGGMLYSVDITDTSFVCPPELVGSWKLIKSDALEFLKSWDRTKKIDFAFIDDLHTYPHVKKELAYLDPLTTPMSVIMLHDLMYGGYEPRYHTNPAMWKGEWAYGGPFRAVHELDRNAWEWATLPWHSGLTILRKRAPLFSESRAKIWAKRWLKYFSPALERKLVAKHQEFKKDE